MRKYYNEYGTSPWERPEVFLWEWGLQKEGLQKEGLQLVSYCEVVEGL